MKAHVSVAATRVASELCQRAGPRTDFIRRGWRAEKRKPVGSCLRHAGASRRATRGDLQHRAPLSVAGRSAAGQSASSWQGLIVVPGGAPMPPECRIAIRPAGAAPRPASRRLMSAPFEWTRWGESMRVSESGDNHTRHTGESRYPVPRGTRGRKRHYRRADARLLDSGFRRNDEDGDRARKNAGTASARGGVTAWMPGSGHDEVEGAADSGVRRNGEDGRQEETSQPGAGSGKGPFCPWAGRFVFANAPGFLRRYCPQCQDLGHEPELSARSGALNLPRAKILQTRDR